MSNRMKLMKTREKKHFVQLIGLPMSLLNPMISDDCFDANYLANLIIMNKGFPEDVVIMHLDTACALAKIQDVVTFGAST